MDNQVGFPNAILCPYGRFPVYPCYEDSPNLHENDLQDVLMGLHDKLQRWNTKTPYRAISCKIEAYDF